MRTLFRLVSRNLTVSLSPVFLLWQIIFPLLYIFIAGFAYSTIIPELIADGIEYDYHVFLATGMIGYNVMNSALVSGVLIWNDRRYGMFGQIMSGPFTRRQYVLANSLTIAITGTASAAVILLAGFPIFLDSVEFTPLTIPLILFAAVVGSVLFGSLASIVSMVVRSTDGFTVLLETVFLTFAYISTAYYPADGMPEPFRTIFYVNPLTHVVDIVRAGLFNAFTWTTMIEIVALTVVAVGLLLLAAKMMARTNS